MCLCRRYKLGERGDKCRNPFSAFVRVHVLILFNTRTVQLFEAFRIRPSVMSNSRVFELFCEHIDIACNTGYVLICSILNDGWLVGGAISLCLIFNMVILWLTEEYCASGANAKTCRSCTFPFFSRAF